MEFGFSAKNRLDSFAYDFLLSGNMQENYQRASISAIKKLIRIRCNYDYRSVYS